MHPILIVGAVVAGLPVLLHLIMKQEPKRLLFPAIRFLKMRQRTNQRKMRLRHILLLLLRVLLIALFALTLWQPKLEGSALNLTDDQPVAAVIVLDTSPSMGYAVNGVTRLEELKRRAAEFLAELPTGSKVAVLDANDVHGDWEQTVADAKRRIEGIKEPSGFAPPVTGVLSAAYQVFATADEAGTEPENRLPRVLAVFSDRTAGSWDTKEADGLKKARDAVTVPAPVHLYFDVGSDAPVNVGISSVEMKPQLIPALSDAVLTVTVRSDGAAVADAEVTCTLDDAAAPDRKTVSIPSGGQQAVTFTYKNLKPGFHSAVVRIRDDNLAADNVRFFTFRVMERRKILTVADDPDAVTLWKLSHNFGKQEFDCTVVATKDAKTFDGYEAVCLISVSEPKELWPKMKAYAEAGGKVFIAPPGLSDAIDLKAYNDAADVMPAKLDKERLDWRLEKPPDDPKAVNRSLGATWKQDDDRDLLPKFMEPFRDWKKRGDVDVFRNPRRAWRYWLTTKLEGGKPIVFFDDSDDPAQRSPALVEREIGKGKVLLLTTRLDDTAKEEAKKWNDYWTFNHSWPTVFPNILIRYLAGSPDDAAYNFSTRRDEAVVVPLPPVEIGKQRVIVVEGPGVTGGDAKPDIPVARNDWDIRAPVTLTPGGYVVRTEDRKWEERFSLNVLGGESQLEKVPVEAVTELFGKDSVIPVGKNANLKDLIATRAGQPFPLFPWLLILVLLLFAGEGFFANRFYRAKPE